MRRALLLGAVGALLSCTAASASVDGPFVDPQVVTIAGYSGSAMEPSISPDGQYLLFNTSNVAPAIPSLQIARRNDAQSFEYEGPLQGEAVNEPGILSGTPTLDQAGELFFVSPRSYGETLSTIYTGQFSAGLITGVHLLEGVSGGTPGIVDFDADVSGDGGALYVSAGDFSSGSGPTSAHIVLYDRRGSEFTLDPSSTKILQAANKVGALNYAASISSDGLELFFTSASPALGVAPAIYRAVRNKAGQPFAHVEHVSAITGFAEGPSITTDGSTLYYHELVGSTFEIEDVTRALAPPSVAKVSPKKGPVAGGSLVRIKGANLAGATVVDFGGDPATDVQVESAAEITAVAPAGTAGAVDVLVTTPGGSSAASAADLFTYVPVKPTR